MSLFTDWKSRSEDQEQSYWENYFAAETENYKKLLSEKDKVFSGTVAALAAEFSMDAVTFTGFLDGINTSLKQEIPLDELTEESEIALPVDFEKLYYNMLNAKAPWLYELPEWDGVLDEERRHEITKQFRTDHIFVRGEKIGRNDPCPCGSGKKYKKCCGKNN